MKKMCSLPVFAMVALTLITIVVSLACAPAEKATATPVPAAPTLTPVPMALTPTPVPATPTPAIRRGGILRVRQSFGVANLDPQETESSGTHNTVSLLYSSPFTHPYGPNFPTSDMTLAPDIALSWQWEGDTVLVLRLRREVYFHDKPPVNGRELTSEDIKYTYERILGDVALKSGEAGIYRKFIDHVETPDRYTAKIVLKEPLSEFPYALSRGYARVLPKGGADAKDSFNSVKNAIGTGPFVLKDFVPDVKLIFERNPKYFKANLPLVDGVEFLFITEHATAAALLRTGELDIDITLAPVTAAELKRTDPQIRVITGANIHKRFIVMRTDLPPFSDVRVRRAISMAMDWDGWIRDVKRGYAAREYGGGIPSVFGKWSLPPEQLGENAKWWTYNPEEAKRLLVEAGYAEGFKTSYCDDIRTAPDVKPEYMQALLKRVGIDVRLDIRPGPEYLAKCSIGNFEGMSLGAKKMWTAWDALQMYLPGDPKNISHVNDPWLTERIKKFQVTMDEALRLSLALEIQRHLASQVYRIDWGNELRVEAVQPRVRDYYIHADYHDTGRFFEKVWLQK